MRASGCREYTRHARDFAQLLRRSYAMRLCEDVDDDAPQLVRQWHARAHRLCRTQRSFGRRLSLLGGRGRQLLVYGLGQNGQPALYLAAGASRGTNLLQCGHLSRLTSFDRTHTGRELARTESNGHHTHKHVRSCLHTRYHMDASHLFWSTPPRGQGAREETGGENFVFLVFPVFSMNVP